ncbi:iron uptake transporter permease EfeU [Glycomyces algeriensis]|uniref:Iron transporter n=1 Tax=Glycomyces algeriensis TaxID=256037 RepID=A0A9W6LIW2_9ACTN|nr:iron uptake transporter permease EfeU [Glycomyces algeriensis]MDA1365668.1 FTR1 family protein [Glycomyces algeriensis]MDR7351356.1 high-affinity iron transporter [Glycomyces algeriensis]GLI44071.1 iron transporter [Glycomyces algeriensis]
MFATFLVGLREGLEAALVVSILVAYLVKSDQRRYLPHVWIGAAAAVLISIGAGAALNYGSAYLSLAGQERFEAITSLLAVAFVTWMIFWMRVAARKIGGDLRDRLTGAIAIGPIAVTAIAFLAVIREGLETALILYAMIDFAENPAASLGAAGGGIAAAAAIGVGLYHGAVRVNLTRFFTWTGALLILVAAGMLKYAVHDFQEAGDLPGLNTIAFDISATLTPGTWYAELLTGMFNLTAAPTMLECAAWAAYVVPVLVLFLLPRRQSRPQSASRSEPAPAEIQ